MITQIRKKYLPTGRQGLHRITGRRGQTLSEYALVIGIVIAAIFSMQIFMKRHAQAVIYDGISAFGNVDFSEETSPVLPGHVVGSAIRTETTTEATKRAWAQQEDQPEEITSAWNRQRTGTSNQEESQ